MARIVSFINYKGGVGKTTTAYHIGAWLALNHDKRVLLVDVDPQTNLTFLCAIPERWEEFRDQHGTLASLYKAHLNKQAFDIHSIIWKSPVERAGESVLPNLDLVPSDVQLLGIDLDLQSKQPRYADFDEAARHYVEQRTILHRALADIEDDYDYILIDCPPNLYLVTQNALAVSEAYVVTALPDHLSTIGLAILHERIGELNKRMRSAASVANVDVSGPDLGGIIFVRVRLGGTMISNMHARKIGESTRDYPGKVFPTYTTEGIGYGEAAEQALPIFLINTANAKRVGDQY